MTDQEVTVVAKIKARKGMEGKIKKKLMSLISPARSERGCISYVLHQAVEDKSVFMFYECWTSKKALDEHLSKPYINAFMEQTANLMEGPVKITLWEMIG
jgi:quinol monooxygenase YgiN